MLYILKNFRKKFAYLKVASFVQQYNRPDIRQMKPDIRSDIKKDRISVRPDIRYNPTYYASFKQTKGLLSSMIF